jgi:hypothetical protein
MRYRSKQFNSPKLALIAVVDVLDHPDSFCIDPALHLNHQVVETTLYLNMLSVMHDDSPFLVGLPVVVINDDFLVDLRRFVGHVQDPVGVGD